MPKLAGTEAVAGASAEHRDQVGSRLGPVPGLGARRHGRWWRDARRRRLLALADVVAAIVATAIATVPATGTVWGFLFIPLWPLLAKLFGDLEAVNEGGESLLDRTMILYGSNLGDANAHSTVNLPTLFAGGGFRHGQHLAFDREQNYPLPNLFVSMLQRMGLEEDRFASSTGPMRGLKMT